MKKGVVFKIKRNSAIIMANDCMFYEIKAFKGMYKGMEICFNESDIINTKIQLKSRRYINVASFILFILCGYLFFNFYQENYTAYAYVGIDINPNIELALNKKEKIIGVRGIDEEGKKIVSELNINKMNGTDGVKEIIKKAIDKNYLKPDSNNEIIVYAIMDKSNNKADIIANKMGNAIYEEVSCHSIKGEIKSIVADKNIKKAADKKGVSVTEYLSDDLKVMTEEKIGKPKKLKEKESNKAINSADKEKKENNKYKKNNNKEDKKDNEKSKKIKEENKGSQNKDLKNNEKKKDINEKEKNENKKDKNKDKDNKNKNQNNKIKENNKGKEQHKDNTKNNNIKDNGNNDRIIDKIDRIIDKIGD